MADADDIERSLAIARTALLPPAGVRERVLAQVASRPALAGGSARARTPRALTKLTTTVLVGAGFVAGYWLGLHQSHSLPRILDPTSSRCSRESNAPCARERLRNLQLAPQMLIMSNPKLESIPEFPLLGGLEELVVLDNGALRSISLNFLDVTTTLLDSAARFSERKGAGADVARGIAIALAAAPASGGLVAARVRATSGEPSWRRWAPRAAEPTLLGSGHTDGSGANPAR